MHNEYSLKNKIVLYGYTVQLLQLYNKEHDKIVIINK